MTNIYLADDDNEDKEMLETATAEVCPEITFHHVLDGHLLLKKLDKHYPPSPDAIFLDINMPVLNGHDALQRIRKDERFEKTPVIIYSTSSAQHDIDKMYEAGANLFIKKPSTYSAIKEMMRKICDMEFGEGYTRPPKHEFILQV
jgi:CheY-like chemotaxis protein